MSTVVEQKLNVLMCMCGKGVTINLIFISHQAVLGSTPLDGQDQGPHNLTRR